MAPLDISAARDSFEGLCVGGEEALILRLSKNGLEGSGRSSSMGHMVSETGFFAVVELGVSGLRQRVPECVRGPLSF